MPITVTAVSPSGPDARNLLSAYFEELISRYQGRPGRAEEVEAAMLDYPSDDLIAPNGAFLLARRGGTPLGCAGLRVRPDGVGPDRVGPHRVGPDRVGPDRVGPDRVGPHRVGEVTRVFVVPSARRLGLGARLLAELETVARAYEIVRLELDTRDDLVEARRLYVHCGFEEVPAFNANDYAEHWFVKYLDK
jgi:GNAT superfamily N-acetyltransferase